MYAVVYSFTLHPHQELAFVAAWGKLTQLIHQYEGSWGSRLHKVDATHFFAYAQWPSADVFQNAGNHLPPEADTYRNTMRECCVEMKTVSKGTMVVDLLNTPDLK